MGYYLGLILLLNEFLCIGAEGDKVKIYDLFLEVKVLWPLSFHGRCLITVWVFKKSSVWLKVIFSSQSFDADYNCPCYVIIFPIHCMPVARDLYEARLFPFFVWYSQILIFRFQLNNISESDK